MNDARAFQTLMCCARVAEAQRCINPVRMIRIECQLCRLAAQHKQSYLQSALALCAEDPEENICLIGCACLLMQNNS